MVINSVKGGWVWEKEDLWGLNIKEGLSMRERGYVRIEHQIVARYEREKRYEKWARGLTSQGKWACERESTTCKAETNTRDQQEIHNNAHSLHTHGTNNKHNVRECLQVKSWWSESLRTSQAHLDFKQKRELKPMQHNEQETLMNNNDQRKVASVATNESTWQHRQIW